MREFAVIGLGRFGLRVAAGLYEYGADVIAVDTDADKVDDAKSLATTAIQLDATDEAALRTVNVQELDAVVVAIGKDMEASILVTALLKQLGARQIIARGTTPIHARILELVGADRVVYPEDEGAARLARSLHSPHILDHVDLSGDLDLAQIIAPEACVGKSLRELDLRARFQVNVVTVRPAGEEGLDDQGRPAYSVPDADYVIRTGDTLVVIGTPEAINELDRLT